MKKSVKIVELYLVSKLKMKIYFVFTAFLIMDEVLKEPENSKHEMKRKKFLLLFLFDFEFPALEVPRS